MNETNQELVDKADRIAKYFDRKYGFERAKIIIRKIAPAFLKESEASLIKVGEKWHWFNLMMTDKCTQEEAHKALIEMGYDD